MQWNRRGFTLIEIMIVVTIIGLLAAIAIPNFVKARQSAQVKLCINNLRILEGAKNQWALENFKTNTDLPQTTDITPYLKGNKMPECPANGSYRIRRVSKQPSCTKYAIGHTLDNLNMDSDPLAD